MNGAYVVYSASGPYIGLAARSIASRNLGRAHSNPALIYYSRRCRSSHALEQWRSRPFHRLLTDGFGTHGTQATVAAQLLRYAAEECELLVGNHGSSTLLAIPRDPTYVPISLRVASMFT